MRLGLHTGEPAIGDEGYTGLDVVRASRISAVGRGGQVLLSDTTRAIVAGDLPEGVSIRSLGDQRLKDIDQPEPLYELDIGDVPVSSAPMPPASVPAVNPAAGALAHMPDWIQVAAASTAPVTDRAGQLIEERVLAELEASLSAGPDPRTRGRTSAEPQAPARAASVADEIAKLRALRDEGALTDEQYAKALDQTISGR